ncbi:MAG: hypothetical protein ABSF12_00650 [Bryobacteraceae bacterium]|jgi:uncharacterized protein (TIGR03437 family)
MRTRSFFLLLFAAALASAQTPPAITSGGIVNGASFQAIPLTPGSLFSIFGSGLASTTASASTVPFSTNLGSVTVQFVNGSTTIDAPISYVQPGSDGSSQINAQVPWELVTPGASATVNLVVSNNGVPTAPTPVTIAPFSPAIFGFNTASGTLAIAYNYLDSTFSWPTGSVAGLTTHPAAPGSLVIAYATGLGAVNQTVADGAPPTALTEANTMPQILIGGITAQVGFAGLSQFPGVYQLNITVPANAPTGSAVPFQVQVGGITSPATFTIAVGNP